MEAVRAVAFAFNVHARRYWVFLLWNDGNRQLVSSRCRTERGVLRITELYGRIHRVPVIREADVTTATTRIDEQINKELM